MIRRKLSGVARLSLVISVITAVVLTSLGFLLQIQVRNDNAELRLRITDLETVMIGFRSNRFTIQDGQAIAGTLHDIELRLSGVEGRNKLIDNMADAVTANVATSKGNGEAIKRSNQLLESLKADIANVKKMVEHK